MPGKMGRTLQGTAAMFGIAAGATSRFVRQNSGKAYDMMLGKDLLEEEASDRGGRERAGLNSSSESLPDGDHARLRRSDSQALFLYSERVIGMMISPAILLLILWILSHHYLPLLGKISLLQSSMPKVGINTTLIGTSVSQNDLVNVERTLNTWHSTMWAFRSRLLEALPLVDMDDEEEFEIEVLSTLNKGEKKWRSKNLFWLSLHTAIHLFLVILSHCSSSPIASLTALVSQVLLFTIFLRAKSLADDVAGASTVVRKASRVLGTHAHVDGSQKLLLQMQVLINKMQTITDVHESHQIGVGFLIPFVGVLDLDFQTVVSISAGVTFELVVLNASRMLYAYRGRSSQAAGAAASFGRQADFQLRKIRQANAGFLAMQEDQSKIVEGHMEEQAEILESMRSIKSELEALKSQIGQQVMDIEHNLQFGSNSARFMAGLQARMLLPSASERTHGGTARRRREMLGDGASPAQIRQRRPVTPRSVPATSWESSGGRSQGGLGRAWGSANAEAGHCGGAEAGMGGGGVIGSVGGDVRQVLFEDGEELEGMGGGGVDSAGNARAEESAWAGGERRAGSESLGWQRAAGDGEAVRGEDASDLGVDANSVDRCAARDVRERCERGVKVKDRLGCAAAEDARSSVGSSRRSSGAGSASRRGSAEEKGTCKGGRGYVDFRLANQGHNELKVHRAGAGADVEDETLGMWRVNRMERFTSGVTSVSALSIDSNDAAADPFTPLSPGSTPTPTQSRLQTHDKQGPPFSPSGEASASSEGGLSDLTSKLWGFASSSVAASTLSSDPPPQVPSLLGGGTNSQELAKPMRAAAWAPDSRESIESASDFGQDIIAASSVGSTPRRTCSGEEQRLGGHQPRMSSLKKSMQEAAKKIAGEAGARATGMLSMLKASKKGTAPHHAEWESEHHEHEFAKRVGISPAPSGSSAGSSSHLNQVQQQDSGDFNSRIQAAFQALERPHGGMHV